MHRAQGILSRTWSQQVIHQHTHNLISHDHTLTRPHSPTLTLTGPHSHSHIHTTTLSHDHTLTQSNSHTTTLSHDHTLTRPHSHTTTLSHDHTLTRPLPHLVFAGRDTTEQSWTQRLRYRKLRHPWHCVSLDPQQLVIESHCSWQMKPSLTEVIGKYKTYSSYVFVSSPSLSFLHQGSTYSVGSGVGGRLQIKKENFKRPFEKHITWSQAAGHGVTLFMTDEGFGE